MSVLAYVVSDMVMAHMWAEDPDVNFGRMREINVFVAAMMGWTLLGGRVGHPYSVATGLGLTAVAAATFWSLFAHAVWEMLQRSLDRKYDGAFEAIMAAVELVLEFGAELLRPDVMLTLLAGGIVAGFLAEFTARRWR